MFKEINNADKEGLMEKDKLIQKYAHGRLNEIEQQTFDTLLKSDLEFVKAVAEYENVQAAIASHEKTALKKQLQQLETAQEAKDTPKKPSRNYKRLAVAIVLILFFGLVSNYFIQQGNSNETLYVTYFEPYPNALKPVTRSATSEDPLHNALYAYELQEYEKAITEFDTVLAMQDNPNVDVLFYKAMSLLNLGKEQEAIVLLRTIKHSTTKFTPQIYWYGALIHIKLDENEKALKALKYMDTIETNYKAEERKVLKTKLVTDILH